jgi:DNA recombination protein RmuC
MTEILLAIVIVVVLIVVALQVILLCRKTSVDFSQLQPTLQSLGTVGDRAERTVREEIATNRTEASKAAQQSRLEMAASLKGVGDSLVKQLNTVLTAVDTRLGAMRETIETRLGVINDESGKKLDQLRQESTTGVSKAREEVTGSLKTFNESVGKSIGDFMEWQRTQFTSVVDQVKGLTDANDKRLTEVRTTVEQNLKNIRDDNNKNLDEMRKTVDEKLQGTLEKRLGESFKLVSERLEHVYKGLGEMQTLAVGVGDLKRVLTNVRARGAWGEVQLERMLEQILSSNEYEKNVATKDGAERVEFAIRLPGRGDDKEEVVWLPIDAKFPIEDYQRLQQAQEDGDAEAVEVAGKQLENRIKCCANDICKKYLNPPKTTDFGILFLPTEGLFAEVIRRPGFQETLQRDCKVVIAGPTTLWSILNSLQMGFRTLAIQKRSSEVWTLLGAVKTEFGKYGEVLDKVQKKLHEASNTIDTAATRTRAIERKLRGVQELPAPDADGVLMLETAALDDGEAEPESDGEVRVLPR